MAGFRAPYDDDSAEAPMVGDHLALDLLNTEARNDGDTVDFWSGGDDVLRWLKRHGVASTSAGRAIDRAELLLKARALRAVSRRLIVQRKSQKPADLSVLNPYLDAHLTAPHLKRADDGTWTTTHKPHGEAIASLLGPVAEAVAELLVDGDFSLVKTCEHPDCILWFYDRTKAHRRRWCSMAVCGNRAKASRNRRRRRAVAADDTPPS